MGRVRSRMEAKGWGAVAAALVCATGLQASAAEAQTGEPTGPPVTASQEIGDGPFVPHPQAQEAVARLKSPFCPGRMLSNCPSPYAAQLRDSLQVLATAGWTSQDLVEWVVADYGEEFRALPPVEGAGAFAWFMPPLVLAVGLTLVLAWIARSRQAGGDSSPTRRLGNREQDVLTAAIREMEAQEEEWF